jgi:hypothetical protein
VSAQAEPWNRLKLTLWRIVFRDQFGNYVLVDPDYTRPLGMQEEIPRPPMVYDAGTPNELETALEAVLWVYERNTQVNSRHLNLVERVLAARERANGVPPDQRKAA